MKNERNISLKALLISAIISLVFAVISCTYGEDPDVLWMLVSTRCVPNQLQHGDPKPCAFVDLNDGYVILKDRRGQTQYLLIPTIRVSGIESAYLLTPGAPNYFADAWRERGYVERAARRALPRSAISLAINSVEGRSQNQLHIHIDCVRADVQKVLGRELSMIGDGWAPLSEPLIAGHHYRAMRVLGDTLDGTNPFILLADGVPGARAAMGQQSLVVVGAEFASGRPGFIILNSEVDPSSGDNGSGEELQDHDCAIAHS
jgi:CDP-diacylglycerol pyrophosphatase